MDYQITSVTDTGKVRETNQDRLCCLQAYYGEIPVILGAVCDGMGGLSHGELASGEMAGRLNQWFSRTLPSLLEQGEKDESILNQLEQVILQVNAYLYKYGVDNGIALGTTVTVFVGIGNRCLIVHVGDSRVYLLRDGRLLQLTKDHSLVQHEIDEGRLKPEEAENSPHQNVLLQCIGAVLEVHPQKLVGVVEPDDAFILCSDGFRHVLTGEEIASYLIANGGLTSEKEMERRLRSIVDLNIERGETDNISAILIRSL